jgi:hypothetical protein
MIRARVPVTSLLAYLPTGHTYDAIAQTVQGCVMVTLVGAGIKKKVLRISHFMDENRRSTAPLPIPQNKKKA